MGGAERKSETFRATVKYGRHYYSRRDKRNKILNKWESSKFGVNAGGEWFI